MLTKKIGESHISSHENRKNVFKYITDITDNYTLALECLSMNITFEVLTMIIASNNKRSMLTLYPDGTSNQIQRGLYITNI